MTRPIYSSPVPDQAQTEAQLLLSTGRVHDRTGQVEHATASYELAIRLADSGERADWPVLVEALRRLGVVRHRRNEPTEARELCRRSLREAIELGDPVLAGEAMNALAGFDIEVGDLATAHTLYGAALPLAENAPSLLGRIEQNLGIVASIQGNHDQAFQHYHRSLEAFQRAGDESGAAIAWHNLGLIAIRRGELPEAERCLTASASRAVRAGETYLEALCELSRAEVAYRRHQYSTGLRLAEQALDTFERIGARRPQAAAYRIIGMVLRESGRVALAEDRLRTALAMARETGSLLDQAEAARELACLHQGLGQKNEAVARFDLARELFQRLDARIDLEDVGRRLTELAA
jgi:tetratricopeptide (TPR) repeat protein